MRLAPKFPLPLHGVATSLRDMAVGLASFGTARERQTEHDYPPIGTVITVNGLHVHYLEKGSGPALILLHGASGNIRDFNFGLIDKLAKNYRVIAIDRVGHGYTDPLGTPDESPQEQARLMIATARQIGVTRAVVAGYSLGGAVALAVALEDPQFCIGLLLMSAVSQTWEGRTGWLFEIAGNPVLGPVLARYLSVFMPEQLVRNKIKGVFAPQSAPAGYEEHIGAGLALRYHAVRSNARQVKHLKPHIEKMMAGYGQLDMPVEILHGDQDHAVYASVHSDILARMLPNARYTRLVGMGHAPHHWAHREIMTSLRRIQKKLENQRPAA